MVKRTGSLAGGLRSLVERFFRREKFIFFEKILLDKPSEVKAAIEVDVKLAQLSDIPKLINVLEKFKTKAEKRFESGHLCFIAEVEEEIVHFKWVAFNEVYFKDMRRKFRIGSDSAYIYDGYTVPRYRGLGISSKVWQKIFQHLSKMGIKKFYVCVRHDNFPALRVVEQKEGFRRMGAIEYTRIFNFVRHKCWGETEEDCSKLNKMLFA